MRYNPVKSGGWCLPHYQRGCSEGNFIQRYSNGCSWFYYYYSVPLLHSGSEYRIFIGRAATIRSNLCTRAGKESQYLHDNNRGARSHYGM